MESRYGKPSWRYPPALTAGLRHCPQTAFGVGVVCFAALLAARGGELERWLEDAWELGN